MILKLFTTFMVVEREFSLNYRPNMELLAAVIVPIFIEFTI